MADPDLARKDIDAWEARFCIDLENAHSLSVATHHLEGTLESLEQQMGLLNAKQVHLREVQDKEQKVVSSLEEEFTQAGSRCDALRKYIAELLDMRQQFEQSNASELAEIEKALMERGKKLEAQQEAIAWYGRNLGFRVESSTNALKIIFTKLDSSNMDREFSFSIRHDKQTNLYTMLECDPRIESSRELVDELNRTNQLYDFIRSMCTQFQALLLD